MFEIHLDQLVRKAGNLRILSFFAICIHITALLMITGCADAKVEDITQVKLAISASVNWDVDDEADGVRFTVRPLDSNGLLVKDNCIINAKLWLQQEENSGEKKIIIQDWEIITVNKKYFDKYGAEVSLQYRDYVPLPEENGILWVEVIISDGRKFIFEEPNVRLGYYNIQEIKREIGCCP